MDACGRMGDVGRTPLGWLQSSRDTNVHTSFIDPRETLISQRGRRHCRGSSVFFVVCGMDKGEMRASKDKAIVTAMRSGMLRRQHATDKERRLHPDDSEYRIKRRWERVDHNPCERRER